MKNTPKMLTNNSENEEHLSQHQFNVHHSFTFCFHWRLKFPFSFFHIIKYCLSHRKCFGLYTFHKDFRLFTNLSPVLKIHFGILWKLILNHTSCHWSAYSTISTILPGRLPTGSTLYSQQHAASSRTSFEDRNLHLHFTAWTLPIPCGYKVIEYG